MRKICGVMIMLGIAVASVASGTKLAPGSPMPELTGEFLTGEKAVLPGAARGKVAFLALGFTYESRHAVEEWTREFRTAFGSIPDCVFYEVPMIGGLGRLARWFIDSGMRSGTPKELHRNVITVYGGTGPWKEWMGVVDGNAPYLILIDADGIIRWLHAGRYNPEVFAELKTVLEKNLPQSRPQSPVP